MTFGESLQKMLSLSGLKGVHLAAYLGYDVSYISRWINGAKLPSLKNNNALLNKVAHFILSNSSHDERAAIVESFKLPPEALQSGSAFESAVELLLISSYSEQQEAHSRKKEISSVENNSIFAECLTPEPIMPILTETLTEVSSSSKEGPIELIITAPMHRSGDSDPMLFFNELRKLDLKRKPIHIRQTINLTDLRDNLDIYCRRICKFMGYPFDIVYDFYEEDSRMSRENSVFIIKDGIYMLLTFDPFTQRQYCTAVRNPRTVSEFYHAADQLLLEKQPIISRSNSYELYENMYYLNYLMQSEYRYILTRMHPIYMDKRLLTELADKYIEDPKFKEWEIAYNLKSFAIPKSLVIFKSSVMSYIFDGVITLFGQTFRLSKEERREHLSDLVSRLNEDQSLRFAIIDDTNPILCKSDLSTSVYLGEEAVFATAHPDVGEPPIKTICRVVHPGLVRAFNEFYTHIESLSDSYLMQGQRVIDFINHGMDLI